MTWTDGPEEDGQENGWYLYRETPTSEYTAVKVHTISRLKFLWQLGDVRRRLKDCHGEFLRPLAVHEIACEHQETLRFRYTPGFEHSEESLCFTCGAVLELARSP